MYSIDFEPIGRRGEFSGEKNLLECARQLGVDIVSICGGVGSCARCKVQVIAGQVSELSPDEEFALSEKEIAQGYRLACKALPHSDIKLHVPPESLTAPQRTQVEGLEVEVIPEPRVASVAVKLTPPTLEASPSDVHNLWQAISETSGGASGSMDYAAMQMLPGVLRENNWHIQVALRDNEIIAVGPPATTWLGLAVDIGTTKIAGYLIDLDTGKTLASKGVMNPQISYGEDVVSRIVAASKSPDDAARLQNLVVETLTEMASNLCEEAGARVEDIVDAVIVGNTAIHHLFLKLPVKQLGMSPYAPVIDTALDIKAREIGFGISPGAYVHLLPIIAGYVGADHVAMLLATKIDETSRTTLAIDIGTNTEICLTHNGKMTSVSCASGPAFEGAHIKHGMRAAPGAIEYVRLENGKLEIQTIGEEAPAGICGSGLLDVVAQLRLNDIVDQRGRMGEHTLVTKRDGQAEFILAERPELEPITISQKDVRELQLAKAAIRMGIKVLVENAGIDEDDIQKVIIAGAFGTFIDVKSAMTIGMLPDLPLDRFEQVGNAAGTGARLALISKKERAKASQLAEQIGYIELAKVTNFNKRFAKATYL